MRDPNQKLPELAAQIQVKVESHVSDSLKSMSAYTKISPDEIVNTALKRFIATHSDYFPPKGKK